MLPARVDDARHTVQFGPVEITYDDSVLELRPWTLAQSSIAAVLARGRGEGPILELCCGAGQIGLAAAAWTQRPLILVDDNPAACVWARYNASRNHLVAETHCVAVERLAVDPVPVVIADPPYLTSAHAAGSDDPLHAVDGGPDGLRAVVSTLNAAAAHLRPAGIVVCQLGSGSQVDAVVRDLGPRAGLRVIEAHRFGPDRSVVVLRRTDGWSGRPTKATALSVSGNRGRRP